MEFKKIKCKECGKEYIRITNTHLWKSHNMTMEDYQEKYPDALFEDPKLSDWRQRNRKGKTYEEQYGQEEGKVQREIREISATNQMQDIDQIKIRQEKCGKGKEGFKVESYSNYRKRALMYYGEECQRCGSEDNLHVHHIDGNNDSETGKHLLDNLMVLCSKCHRKYHLEVARNQQYFVGQQSLEKGFQMMMKGLRQAYGLDLTDINLKDTPKRVARAWIEIFEGVNSDTKVKDILSTAFPSTYDGMIIVDNIIAFSMCPHHFLPVEYRVSVGYISKNKMLGLSKLPRLVKLLAKKPALQEDYTEEITQTLMNELGADGAIVRVHGRHMCMRMRGVKNPESTTVTSSIKGSFQNADTRAEYNSLSKGVEW